MPHGIVLHLLKKVGGTEQRRTAKIPEEAQKMLLHIVEACLLIEALTPIRISIFCFLPWRKARKIIHKRELRGHSTPPFKVALDMPHPHIHGLAVCGHGS